MLGLQYKICYKKGYDNKAADALSRVIAPEHLELLAISQLQPVWLQPVLDGYDLLADLSVKGQVGHFSLHNGLIKYKNRIWLAHNPTVQH